MQDEIYEILDQTNLCYRSKLTSFSSYFFIFEILNLMFTLSFKTAHDNINIGKEKLSINSFSLFTRKLKVFIVLI